MKRPCVLVTGGAGYIGSHTAVELIATGFDAVLVDDLSNSEVAAIEGVRAITGRDVPFVEADCCDREALERIFTRYEFGSAIHFAASKAVGESLREPMKYYRNNLLSFMNLVELMHETGRRNIVFSSSCTVYGEPRRLPVTERTPRRPAASPYGNTKQICEDILRDAIAAGGGALRGIARKGRAHEAAFVCGREPPEAAGAAHAGGRGGCERRTPRPGGAGCRQDAEGRQVRISGCIRLPCGRVQARADARNRGLRTRRERARTAAEARRRTAARSARSRGARTIAACGPCIRVRRTAWADRGPRIRCSLAAADGDAARCGADDVTIRNFELQFSDEASYFYKIFHTFANKST